MVYAKPWFSFEQQLVKLQRRGMLITDEGAALEMDAMLRPDDPLLVGLPVHQLETGDAFYFTCKRSRAHEPAISRLRQWLMMETRQSMPL